MKTTHLEPALRRALDENEALRNQLTRYEDVFARMRLDLVALDKERKEPCLTS